MAESEARFASVSDEDIATLLSNKDSSLNTKRATKTSVAVFYLRNESPQTFFHSQLRN